MRFVRTSAISKLVIGCCVVLCAGGAFASEYVLTIGSYLVDFNRMVDGSPEYATFTAPTGHVVPYEDVQISGPTCMEIGATSINGDQIIWAQGPNGWIKVADDVKGRDPDAVIYADWAPSSLTLNIADYFANTHGKFFVRTRFEDIPNGPTFEATCDTWASQLGVPYLKFKAGAITVSGVR